VKQQAPDRTSETAALWQKSLTEGHPVRYAHKLMRLLPGSPRCKLCYNPFGGIGGRVCGVLGMTPSRKNPQLCSLCCEKMPRGGAEVEIAILFTDIRGSTELAESLGPAAFAETLNRFYRIATEVLIRYDATIDKLIGDEVMAFFVPGFVGPSFKRSAVEAGQALLRALGYGSAAGSWLPAGAGVDAGTAFVGNVGGDDFVDFTALGDPVNTAARIQAAAGPGELLVGEAAFAAVADRYPDCERRFIEVKGKAGSICVRSIPVHA
jgi:adenylate cyclase